MHGRSCSGRQDRPRAPAPAPRPLGQTRAAGVEPPPDCARELRRGAALERPNPDEHRRGPRFRMARLVQPEHCPMGVVEHRAGLGPRSLRRNPPGLAGQGALAGAMERATPRDRHDPEDGGPRRQPGRHALLQGAGTGPRAPGDDADGRVRRPLPRARHPGGRLHAGPKPLLRDAGGRTGRPRVVGRAERRRLHRHLGGQILPVGAVSRVRGLGRVHEGRAALRARGSRSGRLPLRQLLQPRVPLPALRRGLPPVPGRDRGPRRPAWPPSSGA